MKKIQKDSPFTLYHYWRSSCSWRLRWMLHIKGVTYSEVVVNLLESEQKSEEFLKQNPQGFVPALQYQDHVLGESSAIMEWMEDMFPNPALLPSNAMERAEIRRVCSFINSGIQPFHNLTTLKAVSADPVAQAHWSLKWLHEGFSKLETILSKSAGTYSFKGELTLADLYLVPQVFGSTRFNMPLDNYPTVQRVYNNCLALKTCQDSHPRVQWGAS